MFATITASSAFLMACERHVYGSRAWTNPTRLLAHTDSSKEIEKAMEMSKKYGSKSREAKVAWDIVEEIDASDNQRNAFQLSSKASYANYIDNLHSRLNSCKANFKQIKEVSSALKELEISDPQLTKDLMLSNPLANVLAEARASDDVHGPNSPEAVSAWEKVQQMSSYSTRSSNDSVCTRDEEKNNGVETNQAKKKTNRYKESALSSHHQFYTVVDPRSLDEAITAIEKLEHLARQVEIEKSRLEW